MFSSSLISRVIQGCQILNCNCIFGRSRSSMIHLLRAGSVANALGWSGCHGTHIFEGVYAPVFLQASLDGLILGKLAHKHLLVHLLGCKHVWICFWCHFNELFVVTLHLCHVLICDLVWVRRVGRGYRILRAIALRVGCHLVTWNVRASSR